MNTSSQIIKSKLPNTGTSIFAVMSQLANEYDAVNLPPGFPDFRNVFYFRISIIENLFIFEFPIFGKRFHF